MLQIADRQQRIATTSIIIARIRNLLSETGENKRASQVDKYYIQFTDMESGNKLSHLQMNHADSDFYRSMIARQLITVEQASSEKKEAKRPSNHRFLAASQTIVDFLRETLVTVRSDSHAKHLVRWVGFLRQRASTVVVTVPDEVGAYRIFEILNDRGLKASQVDILKNYLFSKSPSIRIDETHAFWNEITALISSLSECKDKNLVNYIRALWTTKQSLTRHKELAGKIK